MSNRNTYATTLTTIPDDGEASFRTGRQDTAQKDVSRNSNRRKLVWENFLAVPFANMANRPQR